MNYSLFEARPGLAIVMLPDDPQFTIVAITDDFVKASGYNKENILGRPYRLVFDNAVDKNTGESMDSILESLSKLCREKKSREILLNDYPAKKGGNVQWRIKHSPVKDAGGELEYIIQTAEERSPAFRDVSHSNLDKAYEFFRSAPVIIGLLTGDEYVIELANEKLLEVWDRNQEVIGMPLLKAKPELAEQGIVSLLDHVRQTGETFYGFEFPLTLRRQGKEEVFYFDFIYKAFYNGEDKGLASGVISVGHDVTSQVHARQKLQESEEKYKTLFDAMEQGFCIIEVIFDEAGRAYDYKFLELNPSFEKQTGLKDAKDKTIRELAPDLEDRWPEAYGKIATSGESLRFIDESKALGRWFDIFAFKVGGEESRQVAVFFTDITEQVEAERKLKESDLRFRNLADESPMFVFILDPDEGAPVSYWNKTWLEYTGQSFEEALGRAWGGLIHPDDIPDVMEYYGPAFEHKEPYFIPGLRVRRYDGIYRWHAFKGNPRYSADGAFSGYVGVGMDIHEQKLAEQALKESETALQAKVKERTHELESQKNLLDNVLKNSSNGITVTEMIRDKSGKIVDARTIMANEAAVKFTGIPRDIFLGKTALELEPGIMESDYVKTCLETLSTGVPSLSQYFIEMTGRWQELTISKMDDEHLIHIFTDITPIKNAQLQLERTIEELQRSNINLEEFAYAASHDLKEPVRKILVFSDRLKEKLEGKLGAEERNYLDRMHTAATRMHTLIDDLLQYSYVSKGNTENEDVDLNLVLKTVLEDLDMEIENKKAILDIKKLPVIKGNKRQMQQLFQNLLANALKYNKPGRVPEVKLRCRNIKADHKLLMARKSKANMPYYLLEIRDNGIGFAKEDEERIFNVFTRLHGDSQYKGSGVGLSIVRKVVENHNGQIWAESVPGEGAGFYILLPAGG